MGSQQIAILIDGGFFLKRLRQLLPAGQIDTPEKIVRCVRKLCFAHVLRLKGGTQPQRPAQGSTPQKPWCTGTPKSSCCGSKSVTAAPQQPPPPGA